VALLAPEEEMIVAYCVDYGTVSQGRTAEDALNNLEEATQLYLEEFPPSGGESRIL
jgi:predicted RNase H-like HicB family nuclease